MTRPKRFRHPIVIGFKKTLRGGEAERWKDGKVKPKKKANKMEKQS